mmetsp:Transcript_25988/g.60329  ORF Transcript_25988/g.60329 Transcript_25988/m.60329 type:complete len:324 (+) Transcript_25988:36-1007(+)|eukprot:CAMPEP_0116843688 /NCGR_PEP_ID=MMETSP0418-20121206/12229_1 /TAXON_ID=1158023 /ORGANISM="Astrosyne radiata, Strain 13vi08-1A" /LENGTH=323 /DNA_ID=CAMNT_0004474473 /DNA_START=14 /DNA_END=985 /DNA_ORIENTATION=-
MTMMTKSLLSLAAFLAVTEASTTTVAVLEFGKGGVVRRTTSKNTETSVQSVQSLWSGVHGMGNKLQPAGVSMVPDLFNKAESGLVLGVSGSGVDLDSMPSVNYVIDNEAGDHVVGHMSVEGKNCDVLMQKAGGSMEVTANNLVAEAKKEAMTKGLSALNVVVNNNNAAAVDAQIGALIKSLESKTMDSDTTTVLHLVVEEEEGANRRRMLARRLEQAQDGEAERNLEQDAEEGEEDEEEDGNDDANNNNKNYANGYYGYGYYDSNGVWKTPYKTIFQIQYFNIVLWTSVVLVFVLGVAVFMVTDMPLEADTLLFGESAKMVGE